jgi:hypothetical protein
MALEYLPALTRVALLLSPLLVFVTAVRALPTETPRPGDAEVWMIWYGSSSAYYHDFYHQVARWLSRPDNAPEAASTIVGRSGTGVDDYLESGFKAQYGLARGQTPLGKILEEEPDIVVLQVVTYFLGRDDRQDRFMAALDEYCRVADQVGAKVYLFEQGWGPDYGPDNDSDRGVRLEILSALKNDAVIVPCRRAWLKARAGASTAGLELQMHDSPDMGHPGLHGLYLNLCLFHAAMTGEPPVGLPEEVEHSAFGPPDPEGNRRRGPLEAENIETEIARYLQEVAWEAWQEAEEMTAALSEEVRAGTALDDLEIPWPPNVVPPPTFLD